MCRVRRLSSQKFRDPGGKAENPGSKLHQIPRSDRTLPRRRDQGGEKPPLTFVARCALRVERCSQFCSLVCTLELEIVLKSFFTYLLDGTSAQFLLGELELLLEDIVLDTLYTRAWVHSYRRRSENVCHCDFGNSYWLRSRQSGLQWPFHSFRF